MSTTILIFILIIAIISGGAYFVLQEPPIEDISKPSDVVENTTDDPAESPEQYKFFLHKDSRGGDIEQIGFLDPAQMQKACSTRNGCQGFNTSGWLKKAIKPMGEWTQDWYSNKPEAGLWLKDSIAANLSDQQ